MYLGFRRTDSYGNREDDALVAWGTNLARVAADTATACGVHFVPASPAQHISVEERKRRIREGSVASDMKPITSAIDIPARPAHVVADEWGVILEVRRNRVRTAFSTLVDDGDHKFHFEWSDFEDATR